MTSNIRLKTSIEIQRIIEKLESGNFDHLLATVEKYNLGIFVSAMEKDGQIVPIPKGYSQSESNLKISISESIKVNSEKGFRVGWFMNDNGNPGCFHCNNHTGGDTPTCVHCYNHRFEHADAALLMAEELDYQQVVEGVKQYEEILRFLNPHGLGLFMLHGHSDKHMFTKLPVKIVSVICGGKTEFALRDDVIKNKGFVPNIWRSENSIRQIAGGFM